MAVDKQLKALVRTLIHKVDEVLSNNDWPTEEGRDNEDGNSPLRLLIAQIEELL